MANAPAKPKKKIGRPTKYTPALCEKLPAMFKNGESVAEVCAELGIWKQAFYDWIDQYPDFSNAYKKGLELSEAWWTKLGRLGSQGKARIQPATWIFNMKNRYKWTDRTGIPPPDYEPPVFVMDELPE
jgi:transposase-like protein